MRSACPFSYHIENQRNIMPEKFPSLWMVPQSGGITPLPSQQHILDFTPLMQQLARQPLASSTGSKGSKNEMPDIGMDMRLGYTRQLWDRYTEQSDQLSTLEKIYTPEIAQQLPEYQAIQRDRDQNTVGQYALTAGKREQEKYSGYDKRVQDNNASELYNQEAWYAGHGLKKNAEQLGILEQATSRNFDPNTPNAGWVEDFPTAPNFSTLETAREAADALFNPAESKMNKSEWAELQGDYVLGSAIGIMKESGGDGNNWQQLEEAKAQAMERMGIDSNVENDISDPMVAGYLQGFMQKATKKGKGFFNEKGELLFDDDRNWTRKGTIAFKEFVVKDLTRHDQKREQKQTTYDKSFQEQSERAYAIGQAATELAELTAMGAYTEAPVAQQIEGMEFPNLMQSSMSAEEKAQWVLGGFAKSPIPMGNVATFQNDLVKYFNSAQGSTPLAFTPSGVEKSKEYQQTFEQAMSSGETPFFQKVPTTDGRTMYMPTEFMNSNNLYAKAERLKSENTTTGVRGETLWTDESARSQYEMLKREQDNIKTTANNTSRTYALTTQQASNFIVAGGSTPELNKMVNERLGTQTDHLNGTMYMSGLTATNISGLGGGVIVDAGGDGNMVFKPGPSATNWAPMSAHPQNLKFMQAGIEMGKYKKSADGRWILKADGTPAYNNLDGNGIVTVTGTAPGAESGFMYAPNTEQQANDRWDMMQTESSRGNPQAFMLGNTRALKPVTIAYNDFNGMRNATFLKTSQYYYDKSQAQAAYAKVKEKGVIGVSDGWGQNEALASAGIGKFKINEVNLPSGVSSKGVSRILETMQIKPEGATKEQLEIAVGMAILDSQTTVRGSMKQIVTASNIVVGDGGGLESLDPDWKKENNVVDTWSGGTKPESAGGNELPRFTISGLMDVTPEYARMVEVSKNKAKDIHTQWQDISAKTQYGRNGQQIQEEWQRKWNPAYQGDVVKPATDTKNFFSPTIK